jgi:hypothetical protein
MKLPAIYSALLAGSLVLAPRLHAAEQTQVLNLGDGWNSVWLEVAPTVASGDNAGLPETIENVFNNPAVEIVASRTTSVGTAEFVGSASSTFGSSSSGWAVWHAPTVSFSGQNTLLRVRGNRPYLVRTNAAITLNITGKVEFFTPDWDPASYTLTGFSISDPVTFQEFCEGSNGVHLPAKIQKLTIAGAWESVQGSDPMAPLTAYWIFAERESNYMGPVSVLFNGTDSFSFGPGPGSAEVPDPNGNPGDTLLLSLEELTLSNVDSTARSASLKKVLPGTSGGAAAADELPLYEIVPQPGSLDYQIGSSGQITDWNIGAVPAGTTEIVTIGAHRNWTTGKRTRENLYRLEVGVGSGTVNFWLPVTATNANLLGGSQLADNAGNAGLWVGAISLQEVSSVTEPGHPLRPTTSSAPLRILLHADTGGAVSLLSHVMIMQTKTAAEEVLPETVLVTNEAKIPFFEGIEERGGKRIGRRIETIGFDMPRDFDPAKQSTEFLTEIATAVGIPDSMSPDPGAVTASDLATYVTAATSRPPKLADAYHLSWPLDGGLAGEALLQTASPLALDPFHRSNPFRHAFHPQHGTGFNLERELKITLDEQRDPDRLTGLYEETLTGAAAFPIVMRGPITLQRISAVSILQD